MTAELSSCRDTAVRCEWSERRMLLSRRMRAGNRRSEWNEHCNSGRPADYKSVTPRVARATSRRAETLSGGCPLRKDV